MSLKEPAPSKRITAAMLNGLSEKIYPQQFYVLSLQELESAGIQGAEASGWRFLGDVGGRDVGVHVDCGPRNRWPAATEFSHGPHITAARNAIRKVVKSSEVKRRRFELRLLAIPALGVEAVWLKTSSPQNDLAVPYLAAQGLRPMHFYAMDRFLKALRPRAAERARFDDSPRKRS